MSTPLVIAGSSDLRCSWCQAFLRIELDPLRSRYLHSCKCFALYLLQPVESPEAWTPAQEEFRQGIEAAKPQNVQTDPERERQKAKLRAGLKREHEAPARTVTTQAEIAIWDAAYWAHPPELRLRYMAQAEEARAKWARIEKEQSKRGRPPKAPDDPAVTEVTPAVNRCPSVPEPEAAQKVGPIVFEREMMRRIELENRKCPDCGKASLEPGKQYCAGCRVRRRKVAKNQRQRKWRAQNGGRA